MKPFLVIILILPVIIGHCQTPADTAIKSGAAQSSTGISALKKAFGPNKVLLIGKSGIPWQGFLKFNPVELF